MSDRAVSTPAGFEYWQRSAQRSWMAGGLTKREMLLVAVDQLNLDIEVPREGTLTNRDLAVFVAEVMHMCQGGDVDATGM